MKFLGIAIAGLMIAAAVAPAAAQQADIKMDYQTLSPVDPTLAPYWQDYIRAVPADGVVPATILAYTLPTSTGGSMTVSYFTGSGICGLHDCTVRIIEDGKIIDSFDVCRAPENHYLSSDGRTFVACGKVREIGANPIPLPK